MNEYTRGLPQIDYGTVETRNKGTRVGAVKQFSNKQALELFANSFFKRIKKYAKERNKTKRDAR